MRPGGIAVRYKHNAELVPLAKRMRGDMTKEERHLWYDYLRTCPYRFSRQKILGRFIVDFYCAEAKLAVELDRSQHYEPENAERDKERTDFLSGYGIRVIRIANNEVNCNFRGVCEYIEMEIQQSLCR